MTNGNHYFLSKIYPLKQPHILGKNLTIAAPTPELKTRLLAFKCLFQSVFQQPGIIQTRCTEHGRCVSNKLITSIAIHLLCSGVHIQKNSIPVLDVYCIFHGIKESPVTEFTLFKFFLKADSFCYIIHNGIQI